MWLKFSLHVLKLKSQSEFGEQFYAQHNSNVDIVTVTSSSANASQAGAAQTIV